MNNRETEERLKSLEKYLNNVDNIIVENMALAKDRYLLINDRINELLERIQYLEKEIRE